MLEVGVWRIKGVERTTTNATSLQVESRIKDASSLVRFAVLFCFGLAFSLSIKSTDTFISFKQMFACRRIVHLSRNLHTSTPVAAGGFSRFNPWAKKPESQEPVATPVNNADAPATAFNVTYHDDEPDTLSQVSMILVVIYVYI